MNSAPNQPPATTIPSTPSIGSAPNPVIPVSSAPMTNQPPPSNNIQPPTNIPPPSPPPINSQPITVSYSPPPHKKFPFMMVTFFLVVVLSGFAGSFLFFSYNGNKSTKNPAKILITPPVAVVSATPIVNPFATTSADLANPFASPSAVANPFGTYENPFSSATSSAAQDYQNPFEK